MFLRTTWYKYYKGENQKKVTEYENKITEEKERLEALGKTSSNKLKRLEGQKGFHEGILSELSTLENSKDVFRIRMGSNISKEAGGGNFRYNRETKEIDVNVGKETDNGFYQIEILAHELKHAYQYTQRLLAFNAYNGRNLFYDQDDEVQAFHRQNAFIPFGVGENGTRVDPEILGRTGPYADLPRTQVSASESELSHMRDTNKMAKEAGRAVPFIYHGWQKDLE